MKKVDTLWSVIKSLPTFLCPFPFLFSTYTYCYVSHICRCMPAQRQDICGLLKLQYHLVIANRNNHNIIEVLQKNVTTQSTKCRNIIVFSVCFYSFRKCDPSDGSQLSICENECPFIASLYIRNVLISQL